MAKIKAYKDQVYKLLDEKYSSTQLFIDPQFPATVKSISHTGELDLKDEYGVSMLHEIEWRRPQDIVDQPRFVIDGFQRNDIGQGHLGDCWLMAAAGALTLKPELMAHVIPYDQTFDESEYTGIFHFRFWLFGEWNDVVIDDRLPCYRGDFVFCRSNKDRNEVWAPLLEKAYAKVCGSYELMEGGRIAEALTDFTGGLGEAIVLDSLTPRYKKDVEHLLRQACARKSIVGCGTYSEEESDSAILNTGLVKGHAYSVTQVADLTTRTGSVITLVRCLNPWSDSTEWNGDWSDNSPLWNGIAEQEKRRLKFKKIHDGEFWMSYDDFFTSFEDVEMCHSSPGALGLLGIIPSTTNSSQEDELTWNEKVFHGEWKIGDSAGGNGLDEQSQKQYWTNPQYLIKLEFTGSDVKEKSCTIIIELMFKEQRERILTGKKPVYMGFDIYKVKNGVDIDKRIRKRQKFYMTHLDEVGSSDEYTSSRAVSKRFTLLPGTYIIIPNTLDCDENGGFLLRIFTEQANNQTVATELTINKTNLTQSRIERPKANFRRNILSELIFASRLYDEESKNAPATDVGQLKPNTNIDVGNKKSYYAIQ